MHEARTIDPAKLVGGLTERQQQVLALVAQRLSLKQVAAQLGVSESAVNQHIRALKVALHANSLADLAEVYRLASDAGEMSTCRFSADRNSGLSRATPDAQLRPRDDEVSIVEFHDSLSFQIDAPWNKPIEPKIVPGWLTGPNATLSRMAFVVGISVGMLALILLGLGVAQGISAALS